MRPQGVKEECREMEARIRVLEQQIERLQDSEGRYRRIVELSFDGIVIHQGGKVVLADSAAAQLLGAEDAEQLVGLPVMKVVHPDYRSLVAKRIRQVLAGQEVALTEEKLSRLDGTVFDAEVIGIPMTFENKPAIHAVIRDITERKQAEEALLRRVQELASLNTLARRDGGTLSVEQAVNAALRGMTEAIAPDLALMFLREGDELILQGFQASDPRFRHKETPIHRVGECLCGLAAQTGQDVYCQDIHTDLRCTWEECRKAGLRSFAALPLHGRGEVIGVVGIASATERDFREQSSFLETLAAEVSTGTQNARLYEQVRHDADELEQHVRERTAELRRFVDLMAGREVRMAELKGVILQLRAQLEAAGLTPVADDPLAGD